MTAADLARSATTDSTPQPDLSGEALALWYSKKGDWHRAHEIAQDIHTPLGSWIHALLHVEEGDQWNADYWFSKAGKPSRKPAQLQALWIEIATEVLAR